MCAASVPGRQYSVSFGPNEVLQAATDDDSFSYTQDYICSAASERASGISLCAVVYRTEPGFSDTVATRVYSSVGSSLWCSLLNVTSADFIKHPLWWMPLKAVTLIRHNTLCSCIRQVQQPDSRFEGVCISGRDVRHRTLTSSQVEMRLQYTFLAPLNGDIRLREMVCNTYSRNNTVNADTVRVGHAEVTVAEASRLKMYTSHFGSRMHNRVNSHLYAARSCPFDLEDGLGHLRVADEWSVRGIENDDRSLQNRQDFNWYKEASTCWLRAGAQWHKRSPSPP